MSMSLGQELSWIFGGISNRLWLFVFIPQLYKNYKTKNGPDMVFENWEPLVKTLPFPE